MSTLDGPMWEHVTAFVSHKRALGYRYDGESHALAALARFAATRGEHRLTESLVRDFVLSLAVSAPLI